VAAVSGERAIYQQLHALALAIYQMQQRITAEIAAGDLSTAAAEVRQLQELRALFGALAAQFRAEGAANDPLTLTAVDRFIVATGSYLEAVVNAVPGAIVAIPGAILEGIARLAAKAGWELGRVFIPVALVALGIVAVLLTAEKSRIVRRVAR
jgi:hypothetical protein